MGSIPILATGASNPNPDPARVGQSQGDGASSGFTLIEVLVVLVIAGVMTGLVMLNFTPRDSATIAGRELERLRAALALACDQALLTGNPVGLRFERDGYRFAYHQQGVWQPIPPASGLAQHRWPAGLEISLEVLGRPVALGRGAAPHVLCNGIEPGTPFGVTLRADDATRTLRWP